MHSKLGREEEEVSLTCYSIYLEGIGKTTRIIV